jgi:hypothetical protein
MAAVTCVETSLVQPKPVGALPAPGAAAMPHLRLQLEVQPGGLKWARARTPQAGLVSEDDALSTRLPDSTVLLAFTIAVPDAVRCGLWSELAARSAGTPSSHLPGSQTPGSAAKPGATFRRTG